MSHYRQANKLVDECNEIVRYLEENGGSIGIEDKISSYDRLKTMIETRGPELVEKLIERKAEKDPVTGDLRYGPKMMAKVNTCIDEFEKLKERFLEMVAPRIEKDLGQHAENELKLKYQQTEQQQREERERQAKLEREREQRAEEERIRLEEEKREQQRLENLHLEAEAVRKERRKKAQEEEDKLNAALNKVLQEQRDLDSSVGTGVSGLKKALSMMREDSSEKEYADAVETLRVFMRNIVGHPENPIFRRIRMENMYFHQSVGRFRGGEQCLTAVGFKRKQFEGSETVFTMEEPNLEVDMERWSEWFEGLKAALEYLESLK